MAKRKLNDAVTYENQGDALVIDFKIDDRALRFIFEDEFSMMAAVLKGGEVLKTQVVDLDTWADNLTPKDDETDESKAGAP